LHLQIIGVFFIVHFANLIAICNIRSVH
jgi:hypothetical protein